MGVSRHRAASTDGARKGTVRRPERATARFEQEETTTTDVRYRYTRYTGEDLAGIDLEELVSKLSDQY